VSEYPIANEQWLVRRYADCGVDLDRIEMEIWKLLCRHPSEFVADLDYDVIATLESSGYSAQTPQLFGLFRQLAGVARQMNRIAERMGWDAAKRVDMKLRREAQLMRIAAAIDIDIPKENTNAA
jgi:hypothetical protein